MRGNGDRGDVELLERKGAEDDLEAAYKTEAYKWSFQELCEEFDTDLEKGLMDEQVRKKREVFGENKLTPKPTKPWWYKWAKSVFTGFFNILLWVGSILSLAAYGVRPEEKTNLYIGVVLAAVVLLTGTFGYFQESKSDAIMNSFKEFLPQEVNLLRSGNLLQILAVELVPGDVVMLKSGDKLPADVRFVAGANFQVDNSSLTGESEPQNRFCEPNDARIPREANNLAFFGTLLVKGQGKAVVINTGDNTFMGRIARLADTTATVETPIAKEIKSFVLKISALALLIGAVFGVISGVSSDAENKAVFTVIFVIGIIVANVPEGLLATVTVSLTLTAKRMSHKAVLVKNLEAVETLGSTSVICSDKTGTLTMNLMTVSHVYYDLKEFECDTESPLDGEFDTENKSFQDLVRCGALCNAALVKVDGTITGDASETALVKFVNPQFGNNIAEYRAQFPEVHGIPFNSDNKWQLSIHQVPKAEDEPLDHVLVLKGAPERVLAYCDRYLLNGEMLELDERARETIKDGVTNLGRKGERVLGFCQLDLLSPKFDNHEFSGDSRENCNFPFGRDDDEPGLVFLGLMSLVDPPRPGVPQAVAKCQSAGIKVIMVTGDHPITAKAIAQKVGIIQYDTAEDVAYQRGCPVEDIDESEVRAIVVTGTDLLDNIDGQDDATKAKFWNRVINKENVVFARTSPQQKLLIVQACQERGGIVAVTGDGVNDSPALKKADIGIAMGKTGTDVAKDAADMILLDDNFASIVNGVEEGRIIFDNLKKSIAYTLSSNIPEIIPFLLFVVLKIPLPLTTVMILMVDLGTDLAPAISLAHETKEADIMRRSPRNPKTDNLVTWRLISFAYLQIGVIQALAGIYTYMVILYDFGYHPTQLPGLSGSSQFEMCHTNEDFKYLYCFEDVNVACEYSSNGGLTYPQDFPQEISTRIGIRGGFPMECDARKEALEFANTGYFISIIIVQWADLLICKTRFKSIYDQGMSNRFMNYSLLFETILGAFLIYTPGVQDVFSTRPLHFVHWLPGIPFCILIFCYDELRKAWIRKHRYGWLERTTYW
uniref:Sodium/potassium-transporting ATPase subunit alpha n=2 Tax=Hirondellea gigas TaxID=1518452 RepID=A0A6A7G5Y4_9CRUS